MGKGAHGGDTRRARRHTGSIAAAAAGATALATAAAVAGWQRRRRERAITPEDSLAGPPPARPVAAAPAEPDPLLDRAAPTERAAPGRAPAEPDPLLDRAAPTEGAAPGPPGASVRPAAPLLPSITVGDALRSTGASPTPTRPAPPAVPAPADGPAPALAEAPAAPALRVRPAPRRVPRGAAVIGGLLLVLVVGIGAIGLAGGDSDDAVAVDPRPASETADAARSTTTTTAPVTAADAFAVAAQRLTQAGSFTYSGTADATDVSAARPMLWLAVATTVEGEVATSTGRLHEVSVAADGSATETVAAGSEVWGRRAASVDLLGEATLEGLPGLSVGEPAARGAALLPSWLAGAVGPTEIGLDDQGRRTFQATIPAALMGVVERDVEPVDATVTLALDDAGDPVRIEIVSSPDGPPFHLVFDIGGLGEAIVIATPADASPTP